MKNSNPTIIETPRLVMKEFHLADAPFFFALNNDWEVMKYTGDVAFENLQGAENLIKGYTHYQTYGYGRWTVLLKETGAPIGWCGLKNHPEEGYVDLGYRFEHKYWGRGYTTEAAKACLEYGYNQLDMNLIVGRTAAANVGSIRVLEKVGMIFWKKAPCEGIEDSLFYKITKQQFEDQTAAL